MTLPNFIPRVEGRSEVYVFFPPSATGTIIPFTLPRHKTMCSILAIGPGGVGGSGFTRVSTNDGGGGGGGGSGAMTRLIIPVRYLPSTIFLNIPSVGGGQATVVSADPTDVTNEPSRIVYAARGFNGGGGTGAAAGASGAGGAANPAADVGAFNGLGIFTSAAGQSGGAGGAQTGAAGQQITWRTSDMPISAGAGGAGSTGGDFVGGIVADIGLTGFNLSGGVANGGVGNGGVTYNLLGSPLSFYSSGGSGGGSDDDAVGGAGGDGGIGSGGGGGGAGATGGSGGKGGHGLVVIVLW